MSETQRELEQRRKRVQDKARADGKLRGIDDIMLRKPRPE